ncbi:acyl-CoA N-acyltransferase [Tricholoma matsutake]|nr:acyl-CoA N-acyltransferase [Tricholoma matsutake 945]
MIPGYHKSWYISMCITTSQQLVATISGIPMAIPMEINFLCIHKDFHLKCITPLLMKEIKKIAQYYHHALNIPVLIDISFWPTSNINEAIERNCVGLPSLVGLRPMELRDVPQVMELFNQYMNRFKMVPILNLAEAEHQFMMTRQATEDVGIKKVTWSYVVENPETNNVTDFFTFYSLPNTVIDNEEHLILLCAYLYYYTTDIAFKTGAEEDGRLAEHIEALIRAAIVLANQMGFHVLNAMTLMDNVPAFKTLKGTGVLNYYLENWPMAPLAGMTGEGSVSPGRGIGIVML